MRRALLALAVLALAAPAPAAAAKPFTLDPNGGSPRVTVGPTGNGFFTWTTPGAGASNTFHYCRVPQTGTTCNAKLVYNDGKEDVDGGYALLPGGSRVLLLDARCCSPYGDKRVWSSTNGGTSFGPPVSPGSMDNPAGSNIAGQAVYAPAGSVGRTDESLLTVSDIQTTGVTFQATATNNDTTTTETADLGGAGGSYQGSLALEPPGVLVAIYGTLGPAKLYWRQWVGGDVNDATRWSAPQVLDSTDVNSTAKLVAGPSGIYVAYSRGATSHQAYVLRKLSDLGWGHARRISDVGSPSFADLVEDGKGVLHFAWQDTSGRLRYRYGRGPSNALFTSPQKLGSGNFPGLKLGVNAAGRGWITWQGTGVQAIAIRPGEPPYTKPNKTTTTKFGSHTVTLASPRNCVGPGQRFVPRVSGKGIEKVVFSIDGDRRATVKGKPFEATLGTKGLTHGTHHLTAAVTASFKKNGHKKTATKDITAAFAIC